MVQGTQPVNVIVLGSSPNAPEALTHALSEYPNTPVVTTNAAFAITDTLGITPHAYFLSDSVACKLFHDDSIRLQQNGALIVTPNREPNALTERQLNHADILLPVNRHLDPCIHHPGQYAGQPLSGFYCIDFALNHLEPNTLILAGFDGYASTYEHTAIDYFDGRTGKPKSVAHNSRTAQYLLSAAHARPNTRFVQYGQPRYATPGTSNYTVKAHPPYPPVVETSASGVAARPRA